MRAWAMLMGLTVGLAGCATLDDGSPLLGADCFTPRAGDDIEVQGERTVMVRQSLHRSYRITVEPSCRELEWAEGVGFSSGPARAIGRGPDGRGLYAETQGPGGRVCAKGLDRVVPYPPFHRFDRPIMGCRIESIERINETTGEYGP